MVKISATHYKLPSLGFLQFSDKVQKVQTSFRISLPFEEAYCLYRLNKTTEALELLRAIEDPSQREKELLAQVVRTIHFLSILGSYNTTFYGKPFHKIALARISNERYVLLIMLSCILIIVIHVEF